MLSVEIWDYEFLEPPVKRFELVFSSLKIVNEGYTYTLLH
jgi:hypothetical protein